MVIESGIMIDYSQAAVHCSATAATYAAWLTYV
jgi:hypothetical protein